MPDRIQTPLAHIFSRYLNALGDFDEASRDLLLAVNNFNAAGADPRNLSRIKRIAQASIEDMSFLAGGLINWKPEAWIAFDLNFDHAIIESGLSAIAATSISTQESPCVNPPSSANPPSPRAATSGPSPSSPPAKPSRRPAKRITATAASAPRHSTSRAQRPSRRAASNPEPIELLHP